MILNYAARSSAMISDQIRRAMPCIPSISGRAQRIKLLQNGKTKTSVKMGTPGTPLTRSGSPAETTLGGF